MRHNPASGAIVIMLRQLRCTHGQAVGEPHRTRVASIRGGNSDPVPAFKSGNGEREVRSTAYQLKTARFPAYRDLNGFDFASSEVNEALVQQASSLRLPRRCQQHLLVGGPGTARRTLHRDRWSRPSSITISGCGSSRQSSWSTRSSKRMRKVGPGQIANRLVHSDLVILDELGYLPSVLQAVHCSSTC